MRKTIFTLGLMLAAALSLTNCSKNEEVDFTPAPENTFELYANVESRTINDGMTTKWADGDQINVFHAVAGTTAYVNDTPYDEVAKEGNPFVTDASGLFKGSLAEALDQTKSYDWYAIYPYSGYITTPANKTAGYVYIGGRSDTPQVQNGNNSTAHIAGKNYPLVGVAKAVPAYEKPAIKMSHISSLIEYNITNELAEDITVTSIEFSTVEDVVGTYYIDFTGETIKYTTGDHISQTAVLTVNNGQAIKNGHNATFYMAIRPFSIDDDDITIKVNAKTATGVGTYTKTLATVTEFHAGQMKTINIGFNAKIEEVEESKYNMISTIDKLTAGQYYMAGYATEYTNSNDGSVTTFAPYPYHIWTGGISTGSNMDLMTVNYSYENGALQINPNLSAQDAAKGTAQPVELVAVEGKANTYYIKFGGKYLNCTGKRAAKLVDTAVEWTFSAHTKGGIRITDTSSNVILGTAGATYNLLRCYASPANSLVYGVVFFAATDGEVELTPYLSASNISGVSVDGVTDATASFTAQNLTEDITVTYDGTVVTKATVTDSTITYSISKNETEAAREGWIKLAANGITVEIKVAQNAPAPEVTGSLPTIDKTANYIFKLATTVEANKWYALIADGKAAINVEAGKNYDYLSVTTATIAEEKVSLPANCAFGLLAAGDGYMMQQADSRYLYQTGSYNSFNVSTTIPTTGGVWTIVGVNPATITNTSVNKWIQYSSQYTSYGSYSSANGTSPTLYELTEIDNSTSEPDPDPTPDPEQPTEGATATFTFGSMSLTNAKHYSELTDSSNNIKITFDKGTHTNSVPAYYTSGEAMRMYKGNNMTISGNSVTITQIKMTLTSASYANLSLKAGESGTLTLNSTTYTWTGEDSEIKFYNSSTSSDNNQVRIKSIEVTYK